jgi:hypothetical protein
MVRIASAYPSERSAISLRPDDPAYGRCARRQGAWPAGAARKQRATSTAAASGQIIQLSERREKREHLARIITTGTAFTQDPEHYCVIHRKIHGRNLADASYLPVDGCISGLSLTEFIQELETLAPLSQLLQNTRTFFVRKTF